MSLDHEGNGAPTKAVDTGQFENELWAAEAFPDEPPGNGRSGGSYGFGLDTGTPAATCGYDMMEKHPEHPRGTPAIRTIAMPADTNPSGDIFGGWLMSQMDLAAGNLAALTARGRSATIAVDAMKFHRAVKVGDEVSLYADLLSVGRTSMKIHVEAWRRCRDGDETEKVTEATFTFVALDDTGRSRPVRLDA